MTIKHELRMLLRRFGLDLSRYDVAQSADARLRAWLGANRIDTVLDVGANDGGYGQTVRDSGFTGDILSFEPLQEAHRKLSLRAARHARWAVAPRMALGATEGTVTINVASNSTSSSILPMLARHEMAAPQSRYSGTESVPIRRLDQVSHPVIDRAASIYVKIDTQGFEMPVLQGAEGLFPRIRGLQVELSLVPLYEGQLLFRDMLAWATDRGFEIYGLIPGFTDHASGRMLQLDGIFFRHTT